MARKKAPISDLSISEKQSAPLAQRLNDLITDPNALKEHLGCSIQAINQYRLGISRPTLENLCKIADFYDVSTDYLLGRTNIKDPDMNFKNACEYMGLTQEAGERVLQLKNAHITAKNPTIRRLGWLLNEVISNPSFFFALRDLSSTLNYYSNIYGHFTEEEPEGQWHDMGDTSISDQDILDAMTRRVDEHFHLMASSILDKGRTEEYAKVKEMLSYSSPEDEFLE